MEASVNEKNIRLSQSSDIDHISNLVYSALNASKKHLLRPANPEWVEHAGMLLARHCLSKNFNYSAALQELFELGFQERDNYRPLHSNSSCKAWRILGKR